MSKEGNVFLGTLTHDGKLDYQMAQKFYHSPTRERAVLWVPRQTSLLATGYNHLWCRALNDRIENNLKWFAILHADIIPEDFFVDKLIAEAEKFDADVMSAVVPIKEFSGVTSTAISGPDDFTRFTRLTMKQLQQLPETFDIKSVVNKLYPDYWGQVGYDSLLLVNTGCFVCRVDRGWCGRVHFTINDQIRQVIGGNFTNVTEPEDWFFSRRVAEEGGRVMATRKVKVQHVGSYAFKSSDVWGNENDPAQL